MPISDLTGTTWVINSTTCASSYGGFSIDFTLNDTISCSNLSIGYEYDSFLQDVVPAQNKVAYMESGARFGDINVNDEIAITGGSDVTNANLIAWLEANGTLSAPVLGNTYELTHDLTDLSHGNVSFTITPDAGYALPSSVTVSNGTLVSYDSTTGVIVVSGDDTTTVVVECEAQPSGYSGNITTFDTLSGLAVGGDYTKIKFDAQPTSDNDYDSYVNPNGVLTGLTAYSNKTKVYVWGSYSSVPVIAPTNGIKINNETIIRGGSSYSTSVEVTLSGDYTISLGYHYQGGGND